MSPARTRLTRTATVIGALALVFLPTTQAFAQAAGTPTATTTVRQSDEGDAAPAAAFTGDEDSIACLRPDQRDPRETGELYNGTGTRDLLPNSPFRLLQIGCAGFDPAWRVMVMRPTSIDLIAGSQLVRTVQTASFRNRVVTLPEVINAVNDPSWISMNNAGIVRLSAALIQTAETSLKITKPVVELRMINNPNVFLGGRGSTTNIDSVTVRSWLTDDSGVDSDYTSLRPFLLYDSNATFNLVNSDVSFLGSDRTNAYGITWRRGSTGSMINNKVHENLFGFYSYQAVNVVVRGNEVFRNIIYGIDPHDDSTGLIVENNNVHNNGSHGIVFSKRVVKSVVRNNVVTNNKTNCIVMDLHSDFNVIEGNTCTANGGDGIVMLGSGNNLIQNNTLSNQRMGLRFNRAGTDNNIARNNTVIGHEVGAAAYYGASNTRLENNTFKDLTQVGVRFDAAASVLVGGTINGAPIGIDIRSQATVNGVDVSGVERALVISPTGFANVSDSKFASSKIGLVRQDGAQIELANVSFDSAKISSGHSFQDQIGNPSSNTKEHFFAFIGVIVIGLAFSFETFNWIRNRRFRRPVVVPAGMYNTR